MLNKQERAAIAERVRKVSVTDRYGVYRAVTGKSILDCSPAPATLHDMSRVILDLCDTSNMIELPLDKDGEVIRVGDVVYDEDGDKYEVMGYEVDDSETNIILDNESGSVSISAAPNELTHKQPVTIESLVARIKRVMNDDSTTVWAYDELDDIADKLESLGDSDD